MKVIGLFIVLGLVAGGGVMAIVQTQESGGGDSSGGPALIANVRDFASDDVGGAVDDVGDFLAGVPGRLGLGSSDDLDGGSFVPPQGWVRGEAAMEPGELFALLEITPDQQERSRGVSPAHDSGLVVLCHTHENGAWVTLEVPATSVAAHLAHGDHEGPCEDDDERPGRGASPNGRPGAD